MRAKQQRRADHAVQPDHQRGEHRIAGQRRVGLAMQHDGGEQRHLDHGHRQGEHKRAVRLAEPLGDRVCVAHGAEGAPHHGAEQPEKEEHRERNVVQVAEQLPPEEISEHDAHHPRDRRRGGAESSAEPASLRARKHKRLVLIHGSSRLSPGPWAKPPSFKVTDEAKRERAAFCREANCAQKTPELLRSANRSWSLYDSRDYGRGFRVARPLDQ